MNDTVQLVTNTDNLHQVNVKLPDKAQLDRLAFLDRLSLRIGVWLVLRAERQNARAASEQDAMLAQHRVAEAERLRAEKDHLLATAGFYRQWF